MYLFFSSSYLSALTYLLPYCCFVIFVQHINAVVRFWFFNRFSFCFSNPNKKTIIEKLPTVNVPSITVPTISVPTINVPSINVPSISVPKKLPSINVPKKLPSINVFPASFKNQRQALFDRLTCNFFNGSRKSSTASSSTAKLKKQKGSTNRGGTRRRNAIRKKSSELERRTIDTNHISTISSLIDKTDEKKSKSNSKKAAEKENVSTAKTKTAKKAVTSKSDSQKDNFGLYALKFNRSAAAKRNGVVMNLTTVDSLNPSDESATPSPTSTIETTIRSNAKTTAVNRKKLLSTMGSAATTSTTECKHEYFQPCQANESDDDHINCTLPRQIDNENDNDSNEYLKIEFNETGGLKEIKTCQMNADSNNNNPYKPNTINRTKNSKNNDFKKIDTSCSSGDVPPPLPKVPPPVPPKRNKNFIATNVLLQQNHQHGASIAAASANATAHNAKPTSSKIKENKLKSNTAINQNNSHAIAASRYVKQPMKQQKIHRIDECVQNDSDYIDDDGDDEDYDNYDGSTADTNLNKVKEIYRDTSGTDRFQKNFGNTEKGFDSRQTNLKSFRIADNDNNVNSNSINSNNIKINDRIDNIKELNLAECHDTNTVTKFNQIKQSFNDNSINRHNKVNYNNKHNISKIRLNEDNNNNSNEIDSRRTSLPNPQLARTKRQLMRQRSSSFESVNIFKRGSSEFDDFDDILGVEPVLTVNEQTRHFDNDNATSCGTVNRFINADKNKNRNVHSGAKPNLKLLSGNSTTVGSFNNNNNINNNVHNIIVDDEKFSERSIANATVGNENELSSGCQTKVSANDYNYKSIESKIDATPYANSNPNKAYINRNTTNVGRTKLKQMDGYTTRKTYTSEMV